MKIEVIYVSGKDDEDEQTLRKEDKLTLMESLLDITNEVV